ncbi:hypothetical protein J22TS3_43000 [Paenibacillus sp. J22TS3]|nr:hypothetical protein J22TS3_43000 [Paenibacillus sp. J22TS3]
MKPGNRFKYVFRSLDLSSLNDMVLNPSERTWGALLADEKAKSQILRALQFCVGLFSRLDIEEDRF